MAKLPGLMFFPDDWLSDEKLRLCSLAARGLWIDILCVMHKCDRRGYLVQANGKPLTNEQLARLIGCSAAEFGNLYQELITAGVASVDKHGITFNRRMVRDEQIRQERSKAGQQGGLKTGRLLKQNIKQTVSKTEANTQANSGMECNGMDWSPPGNEGSGEKGGSPVRAVLIRDRFSEFWAAYPSKAARLPAMKAWQDLQPSDELADEIIAAVERQKTWDKWQRGIIPNAANWLEDRRWEDGPPPKGTGKPSLAERLAAKHQKESVP